MRIGTAPAQARQRIAARKREREARLLAEHAELVAALTKIAEGRTMENADMTGWSLAEVVVTYQKIARAALAKVQS